MTPTPENPQVQPLLLTKEQVSALLNITPGAVYSLHRLGRLPGKTIGRSLRWRREDVERYVREL